MTVYKALPSAFKPHNIVRDGPEELSYDQVQGWHCRSWIRIHATVKEHLWGVPWKDQGKITFAMRRTYYEYCYARAAGLDLLSQPMMGVLLNPIMTDELTPVIECHGDLTFANVIQPATKIGDIRFIDPGDPRGLPCRETDESKLMQSLDGFDEVYREWSPTPKQSKFPSRRIHWTLLATHYIRMLRHVNGEAQSYARKRITKIAESVLQASHYNSGS